MLFLTGVLLLLFCAAVAMNGGFVGKGRAPVPPFVNVLALSLGAVLGGVAIWRSCCQSAVVSAELPSAPERVDQDQGKLECRFLLRQGSARLVLDEEEKQVHFFNCHVPFGLLSFTPAEFTCSTDAIMRVHRAPVVNLGMCLTIVTRTGKCVVPRGNDDYTRIYQRLKVLAPHNHPGFLVHDPRMQYPIGIAVSGSGIIGLLAGCWILPMGANDAMLYLCGGLGATLGIAGCLAGLEILDRFLQSRHADHSV